ncbi:MAG: hypothetical protein GMKNLPBB_01920 [Myxococcota bacterium]|nr:hypothetical protein [Myxococcota bacterium]
MTGQGAQPDMREQDAGRGERLWRVFGLLAAGGLVWYGLGTPSYLIHFVLFSIPWIWLLTRVLPLEQAGLPLSWMGALAVLGAFTALAGHTRGLGLGMVIPHLWTMLAVLPMAVWVLRKRGQPGVRFVPDWRGVLGGAGAGQRLWLLFPVLAAVWFASTAPLIFYDALVYHLGLPSQYVQRGGMEAFDWHYFSMMPQGVQTLVLAFWFDASFLRHELGPMAVHGAGFLLLMGAGWELARALHPGSRGLVAMACAMTSTVGVMLLHFHVDQWAAAFLTGALAAAWKPGLPPVRRALLFGLLAGAALGAKYNSIPYLACFAPAVAWRWWSSDREMLTRWKPLAVLTLSALVGGGFWYLRNLAAFGNPVAPFVWGGGSWTPGLARQQSEFLAAHGPSGLSPLEFFRQLFFTPAPDGFVSQDLLPWLPACAVMALLWPRPSWESSAGDPGRDKEPSARTGGSSLAQWLLLWAGAAAAVVYWARSSAQLRFLLPVLAVWGAMASAAIESRIRREWMFGVLTAALLFTGVNNLAAGLFKILQLEGQTAWFSGVEDAWTFRRVRLQAGEAHKAIARLPKGGVLLAVGEQRLHLLPARAIAPTDWDPHPWADLLRKPPSPGEIRQWLKDNGVTAIFINEGEYFRTSKPQNFGDPAMARKLLEQTREWLRANAKLVSSDAGSELWVISNP